MELIISLIAGALGGNLAGGVMKNLSLGTLGNSLVGYSGRWPWQPDSGHVAGRRCA